MWKFYKSPYRWNLCLSTNSCVLFLSPIDDYAKDGGPDEVRRLCGFYREPLRTWIKTNGYKSAISNHTALKLDKQAPKSYLKITCEFETHILPNKKVSAAKDCG